jgi:hypothetical protein
MDDRKPTLEYDHTPAKPGRSAPDIIFAVVYWSAILVVVTFVVTTIVLSAMTVLRM